MNVRQYLEEARVEVDRDLRSYFLETAPFARLTEAMVYSLFAGGKRIRPALVFASCEAVGGARAQVVALAAALEMIHTYSLIHDDLPPMDDDDLRRGRPTNHKVYGEALAILAGDGLLTEAFGRLADPGWDIPAQRRLEIVRLVARDAGARGMVAGQALDLEHEGKPVDAETLDLIHRNKTGALLRASVLAGGIAAGGKPEQIEALDHYGAAIGLAFQIVDDLLDLTVTTEQAGKKTGKDRDRRKVTYPSLFGPEESRRRAAGLLETAVTAARFFARRGEPLQALARYIVERQS